MKKVKVTTEYNNIGMEEKEPKKIIGLMSGTSCDSIDAALCEVFPDLSVKLIKGINYPYPNKIRELIFKAFRNEICVRKRPKNDAKKILK